MAVSVSFVGEYSAAKVPLIPFLNGSHTVSKMAKSSADMQKNLLLQRKQHAYGQPMQHRDLTWWSYNFRHVIFFSNSGREGRLGSG